MDETIEQFHSWRLSDKRHDAELWNFEYSYSRYLLNLPDQELDRRYASLCKNISFLVTKIRDEVPIQGHNHSTWWWLRKRSQMLAEYTQRGRQPSQFKVNSVVSATLPPPFTLAKPHDHKTLVRYDKAQWLVPMAERGQLRFTPASNYKNEELGSARFDDELNQSTFTRGDQVTVTTMDGKRIPIIGDFKKTVNTTADMYVFCVGSEFDARLFAEFPNKQGSPADACCVIWDVEEFSRRVSTETEKFFSGWAFHHLPISYFDPYENGRNCISPGVSKQFDYAYQREYRFIWHPPFPCLLTSFIDFDVGPMDDVITVFSADGNILAGNSSRSAA